MRPLPRIRPGLLRHSLDTQMLVYDSRVDRVHLLDPTTACVLELLEEDGWTRQGITAELTARLGVASNDGFLDLALEELRSADLFQEDGPAPAPMVEVNRRELMRKLATVGAAAFLIPAVTTLTATSGIAQSVRLANGQPCSSDGQCLSGICNTAPFYNNVCQVCQQGSNVGSCLRNVECCSGSCNTSTTACNPGA